MKLVNRLQQVFQKSSIRLRFSIALVFMAVLPCTFLSLLYYRNMNQFYYQKIEDYQTNLLDMMCTRVEHIIQNSTAVENQVLELAVTSDVFRSYESRSMMEKLEILRSVEGQLVNIRNASTSIQDIYMLSYSQDGFTSNKNWDKEAFLAQDWMADVVQRQEAEKFILPVREARYAYLQKQYQAPRVISRVVYVNQYNPNKVIGLIQVDIDYEAMAEAMAVMKMTENDYAVIVDGEGNIVYAPDEERIGSYFAYDDLEREQGFLLRQRAVNNGDWRIIQVNSDEEMNREFFRIQFLLYSVVAVFLIAAILLAMLLSNKITGPIRRLVDSMAKVSEGNFTARALPSGTREMNALTDSFNSMVDRVDTLMKENLQKENERFQMELTALHSQINSHFLYNTLNTIKWKALRIGGKEIAHLVVALVKMLEYSCKDIDRFVLLEEELGFVKEYLYIQQSRYQQQITVDYNMEEEVCQTPILKMLLQPVVENSILHGFENRNSDNHISIEGRREGERIFLKIQDNGKGFLYEGKNKLTGIGLTNVRDRIRLNYGDEYGLTIESVPGQGTTVCMTIRAE